MRKYLLITSFLLASISNYASEIKYAVSAIPEKLIKNANVVKRMEEIEFEVVNTGETIFRRKYALTILNENGDDNAAFVVGYDKLRQVKNIDGALYNSNGELVKRLKSKDILDRSNLDDATLIDDSRLKAHNFYCKDYPYTVEYTVEIKYNTTFMFPGWRPQSFEYLSVESSRYTLITPSDYIVRFKSFNYKEDPQVKTERSRKFMTWQISNLEAVKKPFASPLWKELTTSVSFAPSNFEIEGYKGDGDSWSDFGKFQITLNKGRDQLPEEVVQKVKALTAGLSDERKKVEVLYNFLQQNTRYISIQLGVGGWQPFEASFVASKGYGDCKALSNYMCSLLKTAGITAYYALVKSGHEPENRYMVEDFPSNQFDHVIVCVPLKKDSMWLECTNQHMPAGYMGAFTCNRKALLITENGGVLVNTPKYGLKDNLVTRNIKGSIDAEGNLSFTTNTTYKALEQDDLYGMINVLSKEKVKKYLNRDLDLSTYEIGDFKYDIKKGVLPEVDEQLNINVTNYASVSGKRIFLVPNVLNREYKKIEEETSRTCDYVFDNESREEDSVSIKVPDGYTVEATPKECELKTKFGSYTVTSKMEGDKVVYHRVREQYAGRFAAKDGPELSKFYNDIYKNDRSRFVLIKKEN